MISPVWGGNDYPITQPYNPAVHCGIDIGCPSGTVIYAARAGVVERVQTGMTSVHVDGSTQRDFYLHGTSVVSVGQHVTQGQSVIHSDTVQVDPRYPLTGPHLHFEVQDGLTLPGAPPTAPGRPLDPVPVLQQTFGPGGGTITSPQTRRTEIMSATGNLHQFVRGNNNELFHRKFAGSAWTPWASLGGILTGDGISGGMDAAGVLAVTVQGSGTPPEFFDISSADDGATWSGFTPNGGSGTGLVTLGGGGTASTPGAPSKSVTGSFTGTIT